MSTPNHGLIVSFYLSPIKNEAKSLEAGREIYEDRECVRVIIPGDRNMEIDRIAEDEDRKKYPAEYDAFKRDAKDAVVGTPLAEWPAMGRSLVQEWNYLNVFTVEQLAGLSDAGKQAFGRGANEWVTKAKAFVELSANTSATEKYAVENERLQSQIDAQQKTIKEMSDAIAAMQSQPEKRGPGRPPKIREDEAA